MFIVPSLVVPREPLRLMGLGASCSFKRLYYLSYSNRRLATIRQLQYFSGLFAVHRQDFQGLDSAWAAKLEESGTVGIGHSLGLCMHTSLEKNGLDMPADSEGAYAKPFRKVFSRKSLSQQFQHLDFSASQ